MRKLFLITLLLIYASSSFARNAWIDNKVICEKTQGNWRLFNNNCGNSCESKFSLPVCTSILTYSCDCGKNRCWDGDKCSSDKVAKKVFDKIAEKNKAEREKELVILKEQEELFYKNNKAKNIAILKGNHTQNNPVDNSNSRPSPVKIKSPIKINSKTKNINGTKKQLCKQQNGIWKEFKNGCVDNCDSKIAASMCTTALTFGCECGKSRCWDHAQNFCVEIKDYKKFMEQIKKSRLSSPIIINNPKSINSLDQFSLN